ncbi:transcriptional activator DEMETER isoform X2 [Daucus carota subsp. sativus]|uniref:transcriptional activator DEMETER isoform X2 n=1 Tax=Daucus carota subsp. sativus TaxID=79200 RepID=UPI0030837AD5
MEGEFGKEYILAPSISEKQNVMSQVLINARLEDKDLETRGVNVVQLDEESGAVVYGNQSSKFEFEATGVVSAKVQSGGTVNTLAMPVQHNDTSYHSSKEIDGVVLATSTPEKQESKKRPNSRIHLNKTPQKKLKNHKPKILESAKRKTHNDQASKFMPKTPLKRSTPIRRSKRSHGKETISKEVSVKNNRWEHVFGLSKDVLQGHLPNSSCKRALKFFEKETHDENVGKPLKVCDFNMISFPKINKRRRSVRHWIYKRLNETTTDDCVNNLTSCSINRRKKRSPGCTKRRIYTSRPIKFICSSSSSVNLLEHLSNELYHKIANKRMEMKKRRNNIKASPKNESGKRIEECLSQESLLQGKDSNVHSFVDVIDKFESPTIDHKYDQLVVRDRSVGASIVPYKGRFNPLKKKKKEALPKVDLDEKSEKAWLKLMDSCGKNYEQGEDEEYWDTERQIMINKVESVISILGGFQGNRSFSRWKGSVMDSIIGAYLTQNVSDHLSSSTFMCFAARFPPRDIKRSSKIHEKLSACLPLELFPKDVEMQKWGNKSTFQEISHIGSQSEIESLVNCASIIDREGTKVKSFQAKSEAKKEKIIGPIFSLSNGYNKRGFPDRKIKKNEKHKRDWDKLRKTYCQPRERNDDNMDAIDWESVRQAPIAEVVEIIQGRGMETVLANEIKVDVNVGRVVVRLGWVPLQPLPEGLQLHLLQEYPVMDNIQKYLFPRLCTLSHETLYELHYHLITFGKIICTKKKPRCDGCPLSGQCKHYASLSASKRLALPAPEIKKKPNVREKPIVEMPHSPQNYGEEFDLPDIEDCYQDRKSYLHDLNENPLHESDADFHTSDDDIPTIRISNKECNKHGGSNSHLVVQSGPKATPVPNHRGRLESVHQVYELPDSHPILQQLQVDKRDPNDPSPYLFAPWVFYEEGSKLRSSFSQGSSSSREIVCYPTFSNNEDDDFTTTVSGTLMIPVRSANKGSFALNGTYFQVNEVFADDESTNVPICVPKQWLSNLPSALLYCGANVTSAFRELPMECIHKAFSQGYYCNRGFNRETRLPTMLNKLFHMKTCKQRGKTTQTKGEKTKRSVGA